MKYLIMFLFVVIIVNKTNAQFGSLGSVDARSLGLAGTSNSISNGVYSIGVNPANLAINKNIFIDFHAEATAEKMALGQYLDGKISAIVGTHTHIQTSDERILPNGTGYITDVGMTGPYDSVIGMKSTAAINRFLFATPQKYETAKDNVHLTGMFFKIDTETGKTLELERIFFPEFDKITVNKDAELSTSQN